MNTNNLKKLSNEIKKLEKNKEKHQEKLKKIQEELKEYDKQLKELYSIRDNFEKINNQLDQYFAEENDFDDEHYHQHISY